MKVLKGTDIYGKTAVSLELEWDEAIDLYLPLETHGLRIFSQGHEWKLARVTPSEEGPQAPSVAVMAQLSPTGYQIVHPENARRCTWCGEKVCHEKGYYHPENETLFHPDCRLAMETYPAPEDFEYSEGMFKRASHEERGL